MARRDRVRGYTIPGPSLYRYLVGIFPQYKDDVIDESIFLVRVHGTDIMDNRLRVGIITKYKKEWQ